MGWYHTGPRLRESDLDIQELMTNYCAHPILVVCEVEVVSSDAISSIWAEIQIVTSVRVVFSMHTG